MSNYRFETLQLHVGQEQADPATDARAVPIYQTTAYVFHNSQHAADRFGLADPGNIYGRLTNSTQGVLEERVAALEGGSAALAVASGAAAITYAIEALAANGGHIVAQKTIYGGTFNLLEHTLPQYGIETSFVDAHDLEEVEGAIKDNTRGIFLETLGKTAEIDIPDVLVQEEQQNMVNQMAAQIQQYGMDIHQYLKMMGKKIEDLAKDYEEDAKKTVRNRLILDKIAELEGIVPTDEEVEAEFQNIADTYQMELEAVKSQLDKDIVKSDIAKRQAFDKVKELANRVLFKREEKAEEPEAPAESAE